MKALILALLLSLFLIPPIYSQNLLPDPGFENLKVSLESNNIYKYDYSEWSSIVPLNRYSSFGLPSYSDFLRITDTMTYSRLTEKYIARLTELNKPHRGDSYFTPADYTTRTFNEAKLVAPLQKDSLYYFQMYVKITANKFSKEDLIKGKIGLWFCNREFSDSIGREIMQKNKMKISPHIQLKEVNTTNFEHWLKFSASFKSDQDYRYVMIGNVEPMEKLEMEMKDKWQGISYRIDDVCLVPFDLKASCGLLDEENIYELQNLYFDINSFQMKEESKTVLQSMLNYIKRRKLSIALYGYADSTGNEKNNVLLSQNRAKVVYDFLVNSGIEKSSLSFAGKGSSDPSESNSSKAGRSKNRRVELKIKSE